MPPVQSRLAVTDLRTKQDGNVKMYHRKSGMEDAGWHQMIKNRSLVDNYYFPCEIEEHITAFMDKPHKTGSLHESLNNVTHADFYYSWRQAILKEREMIMLTIINRRLQYPPIAA